MTSPTTQDTAIQREVFAFLTDPATHGDADVRRIETHAAVVFLAGDRALKVKRAIRFPFLDYSTLAKRKASCEEEIKINRPSRTTDLPPRCCHHPRPRRLAQHQR